MSHLRIDIQNTILSFLKDQQFPVVKYDKTTGAATIGETTVKGFVVLNETSGQFEVDRHYGRSEILRPTGWQFSAIVKADVEIAIDDMLDALCLYPLKVDPTEKHRGARIHLASYTLDHPVQQQPENGTRIVLAFNAIPSRM